MVGVVYQITFRIKSPSFPLPEERVHQRAMTTTTFIKRLRSKFEEKAIV